MEEAAERINRLNQWTTGFWSEIWVQKLLNMSLKGYSYTIWLGKKFWKEFIMANIFFFIFLRIKRLQTGFGLVIRFTGLLKLVTTINYSATANSHSTIHHSMHQNFSVCCLFTGCHLVTAANTVDSSASEFHSSSSRAPASISRVEWYALRADHTKNTYSCSFFVAV
jgi:hypothetical protein